MDIQEFADSLGILRSYKDVQGIDTIISEKSRLAAVLAMGYDINDINKTLNLYKEKKIKSFNNILDKVTVLNDKDKPFIYLHTLESLDEENTIINFKFSLENGIILNYSYKLFEIEIASYETIDGVTYDRRRYIIDFPLPFGYHSLDVEIIKTDGSSLKSITQSLIYAPSTCYMQDEIKNGKKLWGVSIQLYALRSQNNWGIGDFSDLKILVKELAKNGADFVGLNPLHAGYLSNPDPDMVSPYSPSSRQFLNIVYIRVEDVNEYMQAKDAISLVNSEDFQKKLKELRDAEYVNYREILSLKLKVLRLAYDHANLLNTDSFRANKFKSFLQQQGEDLINMATYDALQAYLYEKGIDAYGWPAFPKEYQDCNSKEVAAFRQEHLDDVLFYCYLQFIAKEQLYAAYIASKNSNMVIGPYRDLAVGVAKGSCDVWSDTNNLYKDASVGAPPDPLGPLGQSWGLSPMDPSVLKECAYEPLIKLYRQNMQDCGALRIDHAAGLYRLWWVPLGNEATDGAYVKYNAHDLLSIIALESHRNKCLIIAEDLGTIPDELRELLKSSGTLSYKLFFGETAADGGFIAPKDYTPLAMSAITTHDMPTLVGWWENKDLSLGQSLGLYTEEIAKSLEERRNIDKQRILDSMHGLNSVHDEVPYNAAEIKTMTPELLKGLQVHMCRGSCKLFSSQIEDWIFVEKPVNVPGTFREYPNWRRKLTKNIDEIFNDKFVGELTLAMTKARYE